MDTPEDTPISDGGDPFIDEPILAADGCLDLVIEMLVKDRGPIGEEQDDKGIPVLALDAAIAATVAARHAVRIVIEARGLVIKPHGIDPPTLSPVH
jgi:hypothetical protein